MESGRALQRSPALSEGPGRCGAPPPSFGGGGEGLGAMELELLELLVMAEFRRGVVRWRGAAMGRARGENGMQWLWGTC